MSDLKFGYESSRALIIGINEYKNASPLEYAVSDAHEIKEILTRELEFDNKNVTYLIDKEATKNSILKAFHSFTSEDIKTNDRVFVFFAGHGHTRTGSRGEVGYLVPHDANINDLSSLIRWDEFTKNTDLIPAKHILFIMDACYGGLAVNREINAGNSRFLQDIYQRFSRQVITAGKADQPVADSGGPLPNHSVFTGHLIKGIRGDAANEHGIITASNLMTYVYTKVANDINSQQTPHYGQIDGDGDFIISAPKSELDSNVTSEDVSESILRHTEKLVYEFLSYNFSPLDFYKSNDIESGFIGYEGENKHCFKIILALEPKKMDPCHIDALIYMTKNLLKVENPYKFTIIFSVINEEAIYELENIIRRILPRIKERTNAYKPKIIMSIMIGKTDLYTKFRKGEFLPEVEILITEE